MDEQVSSAELLKLTADIVAAHVSNNKLSANELPQLIAQLGSQPPLMATVFFGANDACVSLNSLQWQLLQGPKLKSWNFCSGREHGSTSR